MRQNAIEFVKQKKKKVLCVLNEPHLFPGSVCGEIDDGSHLGGVGDFLVFL